MTDKMIAVPRELLEELRDCAELCADDVRAHDLGEDSAEAEFRQVGRACDDLLREAAQPAEQQPAPDVAGLVEALDKYEFAFKELFAQCCSNPVTNSWGKPVSMAALNNAHAFASSRLAAHRKQGGEE